MIQGRGRGSLAGIAMLLVLLMLGCSGGPAAEAEGAVTATPSATASPVQPTVTVAPAAGVEEAWWRERVFYEIFVRSFQDSDGDGIGDFEGLIERLDYLEWLGVEAIWLMPIAESPSYHGYDVVDYYALDREYGDEGSFRRLLKEAHELDIKIIVDLVLNHTSSEHPWFEAATEPGSEYRDWYRFASGNEGEGWHCLPGRGCYYGIFWSEMPDLNHENPDVREEMYDIARYWLEELGVDGFRLDAVKFLIEEGEQREHTAGSHAWLAGFNQEVKRIAPAALTVGEIWSPAPLVAPYVEENEVDLAFEFDLSSAMIRAVQRGQAGDVVGALHQALALYPEQRFATFLTNHDQPRTRTQLRTDEQARVAASLLLTAPGVPFIYYGEEIGMQGNKPDEDIRLPMQWIDSAAAGFTTGRPWRSPYEDYLVRNVESQDDEPDSLLNHYRRLIELRESHPALSRGAWIEVESSSPRLYAALRSEADEVVLVLINLGGRPVEELSLSLQDGPLAAGARPRLLMGQGTPTAPEVTPAGGFEEYAPFATLPGRSTTLILLEP